MKTSKQRLGFSQTLIALAVLAAFGPARAQDVDKPEGSVTVGGLYVSGDSQDRARFGLFNGLREHSGYGLFDFTFVNRDPASGVWTTVDGRNLFLDTREVSFITRKPGDWKITADYSEWVRYSPYTVNTGMQGAGTSTPTIVRLATPGSGSDVNLDQQRKGITLAGSKWFGGTLQFEASFRSEDKDGARNFGRGFACSATWVSAGSCTSSTTQWALLFLPDPVNSTINQAEAKVTYSAGSLLITGGYYGNIYTNRNANLTPTIPGVLNNPLGAAQTLDAGLRTTMGLPMAVPPDSQAHQFYLSGNYRFTPSTAATFKYAYTHATQSEDFGALGFFSAPSGRSNLGGELNTTIAQLGLTSRPIPKLSLLANVRYEDRENKTPIDYYNLENKDKFTNGNPSPKKTTTKLEASYLLPMDYRATLGYDYELVDHGQFTPTDNVAGISGLRQKTKEDGYRVELRRSLSESLTGFVSYTYSKREGDSPWLKPLSLPATGVITADPDPACVAPAAPAVSPCIYNRTGIFPFIFEDRKRDKVKLMGTWAPSDKLSLQLFVEDGKDTYTGPTEHGLRDTSMRMYSVDAAYRVSDDWSLTAYASRGDSTIHAGHSTGYDASLKDTTDAIGLVVRGNASDRLRLAADFAYLKDKLVYLQDLDPLASATNIAFLAASGGLPDVTYKVARLKLSGDYMLNKQSSIRLAVIYENSKFNEWTWQWNGNSFLYSDNTTVGAKENQSVTAIGASYTYRWK
jgi:MtrB/PioB family decaheme-associated outer membrane protein